MVDSLEKKIKDVLNEARFFLIPDGGDLSFNKYEDGVVFIELHGACVGCPVATMHLKMSVEQLVKQRIEEVKEVRAL